MRVGEFAEADQLLLDRTDSGALIERAWISFYGNGSATDANALLRRAHLAALDPSQSLRVRALHAVVQANLGRESETIDLREFAGVDEDTTSLAVYWLATAAYMRSDFVAARSWMMFQTSHDPAIRARFLILQGFLEVAQYESFAKQADLTRQALTILKAEAPEELYLIANAMQILAHLSREMPLIESVIELEGLNKSISWTSGLLHARFHTLRTLGWARAVNGDKLGGLRSAARALNCASNDVLRMFAHLDYASVAIFAGERISAHAQFDLARDCVDSIDWSTVNGDNIVALPLAAEVAAELRESELAQRYCEMALKYQPNISKHFLLSHGHRLRALIGSAIALSYVDADRPRAMLEAIDAHAYFARVGFEWRAARMALLLHQLTRRREWRARAAEHLAHYPASPFDRLLDSTGVAHRTLTRRQLDVLELISSGHNDHEICEELDMSFGTLRVHVSKLLRHFAAKNRTELALKAKESAGAQFATA
jgi:DNA-binding CsgD family transcriptional regulator